MKAVFLVAVLGVALLYTYAAFAELTFLTMTGRLGPGFFPRVIGVLLVLACLYNLFILTRRSGPDEGDREGGDWRITATVIALSTAFVALLEVLGGLVAMVVFLFAALSVLNRGRLVQNLIISVLLPAGIHLLFEVWLKASMPRGLIPLPI
jgi:putative tricarboxylic transport membrane protein